MWGEILGMSRQDLSDMAGSASFVVWLFAQSPQLYENYRNSSCEGLSIVFLIQWMAGDATNLIGCLLTQQLPFQIAVATYFCCIDLCILVQYYFYWYRDRQLKRSKRPTYRRRGYPHYYSTTTAPNMRSSSTQASLSRASFRNLSTSPSASIYRGVSQANKSSRPPLHYFSYSHDSSHDYKTLSHTARGVADLANEFARRVAARDASIHERWRRKRRHEAQKATKGKGTHRSDVSSEEDGEEERNAPVKMMDSIYSDSSKSSDDYGYGFGTASTALEKKTWPEEKHAVPSSPTGNKKRGRDMTRTAGKLLAFSSSRSPNEVAASTTAPVAQEANLSTGVTATPLDNDSEYMRYHVRPTISRSTTRTNTSGRSTRSPAASRGAGIVLLGLTAFFGMQIRNLKGPATSFSHTHVGEKAFTVPLLESAGRRGLSQIVADERTAVTLVYKPHTLSYHWISSHHRPLPPPPTWERVIGRISAWTCTVLYMTSRLPQIWTNLSRKSVQGLSILLFISAAIGNALYSASVLINPLASGETRHEYLWESLPFLLGSGGTLIFDAIIVLQYIAWRGHAPVVEVIHHHHHIPSHQSSDSFMYRGSSRAGRTNDSSQRHWASLERQPLLE